MSKILVTGANGQLGRLVINKLLEKISAKDLVAGVRKVSKAVNIENIEVREVYYNRHETLEKAFRDIGKLLLISSSEIGNRVLQHKAVIDAAEKSGVSFIAYTSILHADSSPLPLAVEHKAAEAILESSRIPYSLLRNSWYIENHILNIPTAIEYGVLYGSASNGRFSAAARIDYAEAAAAVLISNKEQVKKIYELAGDQSYTLEEFASEISLQSSKNVMYKNIPEEEFKEILINAGLPESIATSIASSDVGASIGGLFDNSYTLSNLIGHPTTSFKDMISTFLQKRTSF